MSLIENIAANLKTLRDLRGVGQHDVAERIGVSRRTIARIEGGKIGDPGYGQVRGIARSLGVSTELFTEERLVGHAIAVPSWVKEALNGAQSAELIDALVDAARRLRSTK